MKQTQESKALIRPNKADDLDISLTRVGEDRNPVLVIDNFLEDPDGLRALALNLGYGRSTRMGYYPGVGSSISVDIAALAQVVGTEIARGFGREPDTVDTLAAEPEDFSFAEWSVRFSIIERPAGEYPDRKRGASVAATPNQPHTDGMLGISVVIHLSPEIERGGTGFFRHRETGYESLIVGDVMTALWIEKFTGIRAIDRHRANLDRTSKKQNSDALIESLCLPALEDEIWLSGSNERWEQIHYVAPKYNRIVAYPTWLFHSAVASPQWYGDSVASARLTANTIVPLPRIRGS